MVEAQVRPCHKQAEFIARIQGAMGVTMGPVSCHIVNEPGMAKVMTRSGWSANETTGVVGFQVAQDVYVLDSTPWTVLHELVHRSGINGDRLNRFVAEGLTEAIARELKRSPDEHQPTYPTETTWVQQQLLPLLGLSAVQLGTALAKSSSPPDALAALIQAKKPGVDVNKLRHELRPQAPDRPSFNRCGQGVCTRVSVGSASMPTPDSTGWNAGLLLVTAGFLLMVSAPNSR